MKIVPGVRKNTTFNRAFEQERENLSYFVGYCKNVHESNKINAAFHHFKFYDY